MELAVPGKFSICEICKANLGKVHMDTPVYCITCIEGMEKLSMRPKQYRKQRELRETTGKQPA